MTEQQQEPQQNDKPQINPEFFVRVNDILEQANRIERRLDSNHAQLVMVHAFCRYSAHHFRQVVKPGTDSAEERGRFADYISAITRESILKHLDDLAGTPGAQANEQAEKNG